MTIMTYPVFFLSFFLLYGKGWRHVDKTGPEGNIDAFLQYGQGTFSLFS